AAIAQSASSVAHLFELESPGAGTSESVFEARARGAAEKAQHEKAVLTARLEKRKKKEAAKHCNSSSWASEIDCGVCLETTMDDDERCLSDPSSADNSSRDFGPVEVHSANEAADEASEGVIDLDTDKELDTMEVNYDSDDDDDGSNDVDTKMLDNDIDLDRLDLDFGENGVTDDVTDEETQGKEKEQEEREELEEQERQSEQEEQEEQEGQGQQSEQNEQEERFWTLGKSVEEKEVRHALRKEIFTNEKVNLHGPAFVDSSALMERNTVIEAFCEIRHAMKL
ncbi:hypothetical protein BGZ75_000419, partial [Mortierella antarctica]